MSELNIYHFVQHIIRQAKRKQESRDSQAIREIAALRSGMSITTEYRAYPYVLPSGRIILLGRLVMMIRWMA